MLFGEAISFEKKKKRRTRNPGHSGHSPTTSSPRLFEPCLNNRTP
jgi:hypothetical protein